KGLEGEAFAEYKKAVTSRRKLPDAKDNNGVAWLLANYKNPKFRDPKLAVEAAKRAVKLAPQVGTYWNTLGVAHFRAGDWNAALLEFEKSMILRNGGDAFDWFFLAMTLWQLGHQSAARQWYDRGVRWLQKNAPKNDELERFREEAAALLKVD